MTCASKAAGSSCALRQGNVPPETPQTPPKAETFPDDAPGPCPSGCPRSPASGLARTERGAGDGATSTPTQTQGWTQVTRFQGLFPQGCGSAQRQHPTHRVCPHQAFPCHPARRSPCMGTPTLIKGGGRRRRVQPVEKVLEKPSVPAGPRGLWDVTLPAQTARELSANAQRGPRTAVQPLLFLPSPPPLLAPGPRESSREESRLWSSGRRRGPGGGSSTCCFLLPHRDQSTYLKRLIPQPSSASSSLHPSPPSLDVVPKLIPLQRKISASSGPTRVATKGRGFNLHL